MSEEKKMQAEFGADEPGTITIPETVIQPYPTIKKGSRGPTVAKWQRMIGVTADGNFGSGTDAATRKWQGDNGLTADGVVGIQSWGKMLETTTPAGMLALEWNQASAEIPAPPAPTTVIPPVPGAMPINPSAPVKVSFQVPGAPAGVKSPTPQVHPEEAGIFGAMMNAPLWLKALTFLGVGAAVVASKKK